MPGTEGPAHHHSLHAQSAWRRRVNQGINNPPLGLMALTSLYEIGQAGRPTSWVRQNRSPPSGNLDSFKLPVDTIADLIRGSAHENAGARNRYG